MGYAGREPQARRRRNYNQCRLPTSSRANPPSPSSLHSHDLLSFLPQRYFQCSSLIFPSLGRRSAARGVHFRRAYPPRICAPCLTPTPPPYLLLTASTTDAVSAPIGEQDQQTDAHVHTDVYSQSLLHRRGPRARTYARTRPALSCPHNHSRQHPSASDYRSVHPRLRPHLLHPSCTAPPRPATHAHTPPILPLHQSGPICSHHIKNIPSPPHIQV